MKWEAESERFAVVFWAAKKTTAAARFCCASLFLLCYVFAIVKQPSYLYALFEIVHFCDKKQLFYAIPVSKRHISSNPQQTFLVGFIAVYVFEKAFQSQDEVINCSAISHVIRLTKLSFSMLLLT